MHNALCWTVKGNNTGIHEDLDEGHARHLQTAALWLRVSRYLLIVIQFQFQFQFQLKMAS